ncbi:hypothetical protein COO16_04315 [Bacillus pseudomycoides]|uniref:hypothetical protein n=1 Tax=Bacillus pseudomycoides TaxID=64104 RepID=UPI000BED6893|nr:hypothetical protein [Bacillus pseudomycoides]PDY14192.1 hypothetical protein COO16_04315 [Bacillus pseudomycoides]
MKKQVNIRLEESVIEKLDTIQDVLSQRTFDLYDQAENLPYIPSKSEWTRTEVLTYAIEEMYKKYILESN